MKDREERPRFGIPSLSGGALKWFYGIFTVGTGYLTVANTFSAASRMNSPDILQIQAVATEQLARSAGASLVVAYILADGGDMVISAILRERNRQKDLEALRKAREDGLQEGLEEGRQEGGSEVQSLWETWNRRRQEAEERGEAFSEPHPEIGGRNGADH